MASIEKDIEVDVPVRTAYDQWTQFEEFPKFMEGVKTVRQLNDKNIEWHAEVLGKDVSWTSEIVQQIPDERITWKSTSGAWNAGAVRFTSLSATRTKVSLLIEYEPTGVAENAASALGFVSLRVAGDLNRFKEFIEGRARATGQWRGEIHGQRVTT